jgi:phage shock protein A
MVAACNCETCRLARIERSLLNVLLTLEKTMATVEQLAQAVTDLKAAVAPLPQAIDDLEAKITAALAGALTPEQQAKIDAAFAEVGETMSTVATALADASDGVDEGAGGGGPV